MVINPSNSGNGWMSDVQMSIPIQIGTDSIFGRNIYLFICSILYAVRPDRPPLPQAEGAIGGWWCALYIRSTPPSPSRAAGGWAGVVYTVRHNNNTNYILTTVAYAAKPLRSRHVESCTYTTRQVQSFFFLGQ